VRVASSGDHEINLVIPLLPIFELDIWRELLHKEFITGSVLSIGFFLASHIGLPAENQSYACTGC
jgi:hypothetical protein